MTPPAVILAGGLGTRLVTVTGDVLPKALVPVNGLPFIDLKLTDLAHHGVDDALILTGHHGDQIAEHVGDGRRFGLRARCVADGPWLRGTGGAIRAVLTQLPDAFWVTYGDSLVDVDLVRAEAAFRDSRRLALMTVLHNRDAWGRSNAVVAGDRVTAYAKNPPPTGAEYIDYGMLMLTRDAFAETPDDAAFDLTDLLGRLVTAGEVTAFEVTTRFYDIGTPQGLAETEAHLARYPVPPPTEGSP